MGASYNFWNLESRHPGILESPGFGWFLLITMYRVFFPLSFCPWTLFSMQNSKTLSSLKSSRNHLEFWNSFWKWPNFCQVQQIGCFSHAIFGPQLDFQPWLTHKEKTWSSMALACFCKFQSVGYSSYLKGVAKTIIQLSYKSIKMQLKVWFLHFIDRNGWLQYFQI